MLYRVSGALFCIFGALQLFGYLAGSDQPRTGESAFASGQYGAAIGGIALAIVGTYLLVKRRS